MYNGVNQLFIDNRLDRYPLNSAMSGDFVYEEDGSLAFHIQNGSPGADKEANWLPAPAFYLIIRLYLPEQEVLDGAWTAPVLQKSR